MILMEPIRKWLRRLQADEIIEDSTERDLLADVLRCLGEHAFDIPSRRASETRDRFHRLAFSVQSGDMAHVKSFTCEQRCEERQFVLHHLNDLCDLTWILIGGLSRLTQHDVEADHALSTQVESISTQLLKDAQSIDLQTLKETLQALTQIIEEREQQHQSTLRGLQEQVHGLMHELEQARHENSIDPLTELFNRRAFENHLKSTVELNLLFKHSAVMILLDIDHFKAINDNYGHQAGDEVLKIVAERLVSVCKRRGDFVARYGGEEFAVIMRDTNLREAVGIARKIIHAVKNEPVTLIDDNRILMTVSLGVSELKGGETAEQWLMRTDELLYKAKHTGRDRLAA
jgi:diguanylate cyclase